MVLCITVTVIKVKNILKVRILCDFSHFVIAALSLAFTYGAGVEIETLLFVYELLQMC